VRAPPSAPRCDAASPCLHTTASSCIPGCIRIAWTLSATDIRDDLDFVVAPHADTRVRRAEVDACATNRAYTREGGEQRQQCNDILDRIDRIGMRRSTRACTHDTLAALQRRAAAVRTHRMHARCACLGARHRLLAHELSVVVHRRSRAYRWRRMRASRAARRRVDEERRDALRHRGVEPRAR
jgi:hypothetical protein